MIKTEQIAINGQVFVRTYSDENRYVMRNGQRFEDAVDPADSGRTYTEGEPIPETEGTVEDRAEAYDILTGVSE